MAKISEDQQFLAAHVDEFFADEMSPKDSLTFKRLLESDEHAQNIDRLKNSIGLFQMGMQAHFLSDEQKIKLRELAEDGEQRKTREVQKINDIERAEAFSDFRTRAVIAAFVIAVICALVYYFTPQPKPPFDPLQTLVYEAAVVEERGLGRIDLPTEDYADVLAYAKANRGLGFDAYLPEAFPAEWATLGATVIDYDTRQILNVVLKHKIKEEKIFYFNFKGTMAELPKAEAFKEGSRDFLPFANDVYNIVCWQATPDSVGMILGRRSARELARMIP